MRKLTRFLALAALAMVAMAAFAARDGVFAHAALIGSTPVEGSVAAAAPESIRLRFNEPVKPLAMRITSVDGGRTVELDASSSDNDVVAKPPPNLGGGTHILSWRAVSSDGHPIGGTISFAIGAPSVGAALPATAQTRDMLRSALIWLARFGISIGLFIGVGGAFFQVWIAPRKIAGAACAGLVVRIALAIGCASALAGVGLQGVDALDAPLSSLRFGDAWRTGFTTAYGLTLATAIIAFVIAAVSQRAGLTHIVERALAALALMLIGGALSLSGHASSAQPQWLTRAAVFVHGVGIAYWLGALAPLALMLASKARRDRNEFFQTLRRFSGFAIPVVAAMTVAGSTLAIIQVQSLSALIETAYGRVFLVKLAFVAALLALAALNRFRWTPAMSDAQSRSNAQRRLFASVCAELALAIAIIAIAALWRFTPPPRALALIAAAPAQIHIHAADAMADIALTPGRAGPARITIDVLDGEFGALTPKEVTVFLSNPSMGVEEIERAARQAAGQDGRWEIDRVVLPIAGRWTIRVDLLITDFRKVTLEDAIDIRP